ncbi:MAG: hypothetical protein ABEK50_11705 [bacterium]
MVDAVMLQDSVIVAGHPRSGTSLACQLLTSAGVEFPSDFEGDDYNQAGYFELEESKDLSKRLIDEAMTTENTRDMNTLVRRLNDIEGFSGLKLVRIPALFFYRHIAKNLKVVFVFRRPENVKASLLKRGISGFPISWIDNNNASIAGHENIEESILVSYESMLDQADHVSEGFNKLGFDVDLSIVSRDQQTQSNSDVYVTQDERNMYQHLRELETESCASSDNSTFF